MLKNWILFGTNYTFSKKNESWSDDLEAFKNAVYYQLFNFFLHTVHSKKISHSITLVSLCKHTIHTSYPKLFYLIFLVKLNSFFLQKREGSLWSRTNNVWSWMVTWTFSTPKGPLRRSTIPIKSEPGSGEFSRRGT